MNPRRRGARLLFALALLAAASSSFAQNQPLSVDYANIMQWLSQETANGLAFNAGSTFDPPNEIAPYLIQPDFSLGIGYVPFRKDKFPQTQQSLQDIGIQSFFPSSIMFPNLTAHVRMGLPERFDVSLRFADMTIPKGYKLTSNTKGDGQSNTIGASIRRHFLGEDDDPLISVSLNLNHVFGHFNLQNSFSNLQITPGFYTDAQNSGRIQWSVTSIGVNVVGSKNYGAWTPFAGLGLNKASGSVQATLTSVFDTPLFSPASGSASNAPESVNGRFIFGAQRDWAPCGLFMNGEIKTIGSESFKTFIVSFGVARPFSFGVGVDRPEPRRAGERRIAWPDSPRDSYTSSSSYDEPPMRDAPASLPEPAPDRPSSQPPDIILIQ